MTTEIAIFRPEGDQIEQAQSHWAASFMASISTDSSFSVTDFRRTGVDRSSLAQDVAGADFVMFFGHGESGQLANKDSNIATPYFINAQDGAALTGRIVAGIACHAGRRLGPELVTNHGVNGYLGFDDLLIVITNVPSLFAAVTDAALRALVDPTRGGSEAAKTAIREFRAVRDRHIAIANDPNRSQQDRLDATLIWMGAHGNSRTVVWRAGKASGGGARAGAGASASTTQTASQVDVVADIDGYWYGDHFVAFDD